MSTNTAAGQLAAAPSRSAGSRISAGSILRGMRAIAARIAHRRRVARDMRYLKTLPDRLLDDVGLTRDDLR